MKKAQIEYDYFIDKMSTLKTRKFLEEKNYNKRNKNNSVKYGQLYRNIYIGDDQTYYIKKRTSITKGQNQLQTDYDNLYIQAIKNPKNIKKKTALNSPKKGSDFSSEKVLEELNENRIEFRTQHFFGGQQRKQSAKSKKCLSGNEFSDEEMTTNDSKIDGNFNFVGAVKNVILNYC